MKFADCINIVGERPRYYNGLKRYVSTGAIDTDHIDESAVEMVKYDERPSRANLMAMPGDLIFAKMADTQKTLLLTEETAKNIYSTGFFAVQAKEEIINPECLYFLLGSSLFLNQKNKNASGATQRAITNNGLKEIEIHLPPFDVQKKIAKELKIMADVIGFRKRQIQDLDTLIKARFVEMFGNPVLNPQKWDTIELGELTEIGSSKRIFEKEYVSKGVPFYRTKEIVELSKGNPISTELYITEERFAQIKEQYGVPRKDDLLISAVGTIGVIWIVDGKNEFYFKDGNLIRVDSSDKFNSIYMKTLLENLIAEQKKQMSAGTAYSALTISGLEKMKVYDVPMGLQNRFAAFVTQVDKSKFVDFKNIYYLD